MSKVNIGTLRENLRLRWSYEGKRYCLSVGLKDSPTNRAIAQMKATAIERDIEYQMFDTSLMKYQKEWDGRSLLKVWQLFEKYIQSKKGHVYEQSLSKYYGLLTSLKTYFKDRNAGSLTAGDAEKFKAWLADRLAPVTLKQQLTMLKSGWEWAIERKMIVDNPWRDVTKRVPRGVVKRPRPFSMQEIQKIVQRFRTHPDYAYYSDYVEFLLGSGCRIGEVIALTWSDVSDDCSQIWIGKAYYRGDLKETKTDKSGFVPLSQSLKTLLLRRKPPNADPATRIFPAARGGYIDDANFRNRAWKTVLGELGIEYRKPYTTRSTLISYWLSQGEDPLIVAKYTRTSVKMIYEHYADYIPSKARLPELLGDVFAVGADGSGTGDGSLEMAIAFRCISASRWDVAISHSAIIRLLNVSFPFSLSWK